MLRAQQAQIMQANLQKMIKNQNYYSCFLENNENQNEPIDPFRKRMFDKNLRKSSVSCGHYNSNRSYQINQQGKCQIQIQKIRHNNQIRNIEYNLHNLDSKLQIQNQQNIILAQSRQVNIFKNKISQYVSNFKKQLDYLQQKLHKKVDQIERFYQNFSIEERKNYSINQYQKNENEFKQIQRCRQLDFMVQNLQKMIGFMIQNCLNLQQNICYSGLERKTSDRQSFNESQTNIVKINKQTKQSNRKDKIIMQKFEKQKVNMKRKSQKKEANYFLSDENEKENQIPNVYFVNDKIYEDKRENYSKNEFSFLNAFQNGQHKINNRQNEKIKRFYNEKQYHEQQNKQSQHNSQTLFKTKKNMKSTTILKPPIQPSISVSSESHPKSIYETVLQERERKIKNKKKII